MSSRPTKHEYFISMLGLVAARSTCIRRAVGCIITDKEGHILATGYNGVPSGFDHCVDTPCLGASDRPGDNRLCMAVHAEQNALLQCTDRRSAAIMYCSCTPCFICAKMIANTDVQYIYALEEYADKAGLTVLLEKGIIVEINGKVYVPE